MRLEVKYQCHWAGLVGVALISGVAFAEEPKATYEAEFVEGKIEITNNYEQRTPPTFETIDGEKVLSFTFQPHGKKADTMWGLKTENFKVTPGMEYFVLFDLQGHMPIKGGTPGATITWLDAKGESLKFQDALGHISSISERIKTPERAKNLGRVKAYTRGIVPQGAAAGVISYAVDSPNLMKGEKVTCRRIAYFEHPRGEPYALNDVDGPKLKLITKTPNANVNEPLVFEIEDESEIDWRQTEIKIDGKVVRAGNELVQNGKHFEYIPPKPWNNNTLHVVEMSGVDVKGNGSRDSVFVAITDQKVQHPKCAIRDDGMLLVDGKPRFPLGWFRVRPCEGNGQDLDRGIREMKENGLNFAHTYMVYKYGSASEDAAFEELVKACAKYGVMLYTEPSSRDLKSSKFLPLMNINLFRGLSYGMPLFWGIGDDTSRFHTPEDLRHIYRCCKSVDPDALTISADVSTGPHGHIPYAPWCDMLFLEIYPIKNPKVPDPGEMAMVSTKLDDAWNATFASGCANRTVVSIPQAFKGWNAWQRLPNEEEIRCQAYLGIACRARGLVYYASCGNRANVQPPDKPVEYGGWGPWNDPEYKAVFYRVMRELAALEESLVLYDARVQPTVKILRGPEKNVRGGPSIRCLLKDDGLLVAANSSHLEVEAEITMPNGLVIREVFPRNGTMVRR